MSFVRININPTAVPIAGLDLVGLCIEFVNRLSECVSSHYLTWLGHGWVTTPAATQVDQRNMMCNSSSTSDSCNAHISSVLVPLQRTVNSQTHSNCKSLAPPQTSDDIFVLQKYIFHDKLADTSDCDNAKGVQLQVPWPGALSWTPLGTLLRIPLWFVFRAHCVPPKLSHWIRQWDIIVLLITWLVVDNVLRSILCNRLRMKAA